MMKQEGMGLSGDDLRGEGFRKQSRVGRRGPVGTRTDLTSSPTMERATS